MLSWVLLAQCFAERWRKSKKQQCNKIIFTNFLPFFIIYSKQTAEGPLKIYRYALEKAEKALENDLSALVFLEAEGCRNLDILGSGLNTEEEESERM